MIVKAKKIDSPVEQSMHLNSDRPEKIAKSGREANFKGRIGNRKGVPNKTTVDVRKAIALIAEKNVNRLDSWLTRIGRKDPARAMELYLRMIEYHIPKLTRAEIVRPDDKNQRVIDSSQLTPEQREQLRQMILATQPAAALIEQQPSTLANFVQPGGLGDAQVIDSIEDDNGSTSS